MKKEAIFGIILVLLMITSIFFIINYPENELHDHSVEIEGKDMKLLTVQEVADLWEIDSEALLYKIVSEFELEENYTSSSVLEEIRGEYSFSPALIKDIAEEIKRGNLTNE